MYVRVLEAFERKKPLLTGLKLLNGQNHTVTVTIKDERKERLEQGSEFCGHFAKSSAKIDRNWLHRMNKLRKSKEY